MNGNVNLKNNFIMITLHTMVKVSNNSRTTQKAHQIINDLVKNDPIAKEAIVDYLRLIERKQQDIENKAKRFH